MTSPPGGFVALRHPRIRIANFLAQRSQPPVCRGSQETLLFGDVFDRGVAATISRTGEVGTL